MKKIFTLSLLASIFCTTQLSFGQWNQVGNPLDGGGLGTVFGQSVDITNDGNIIAVGDYFADPSGISNAGMVRVYEKQNGSWVQLGNTIEGETQQELSGWSLSLNADGTRIAVGAYGYDSPNQDQGIVRVYYLNNGTWTLYSSPLPMRGESSGDNAGWSVSMSGDGNRVAIGARLNDGNGTSSGQVRVFEYINNGWNQVGSDIDGVAGNDRFGYSVSMNHDGTIFAAGGRFHDNNKGHVRVFQQSGNTWNQLGSELDGESSQDNFGSAVSIDSVGNTLIVGARRNDGNGNNAGHARVFEYSGGNWSQIGSDLDGASDDNEFGTSVAINPAGTVVAVGEPLSSNGPGDGRVSAFYNNNGTWTLLGNTIENEGNFQKLGSAVALSSDTSLVMGDPRGYVGSTGRAVVKKYGCLPTAGTEVVTACDSYTWADGDGNTYTSSTNSATHTLMNAQGCDSVVTLDLTINSSSFGTDAITACNGHTWIDGNTYTSNNNSATVILTNSLGCDSTVTLDLTINEAANSFSVVSACDSYTWSAGNGTTYTSSANGETHVIANGAANGCDSIMHLDVSITPAPTPTITQNGTTLEAPTGFDSYQWYDDNGAISGATSDTYSPMASGNYYCIVEDNGCTGSSNSILYMPTGVHSLSAKDIQLYPNPTNDVLNISTQSRIDQLVLMDLRGKVLRTQADADKVDLSNLQAGIYLLRVDLAEGSITTRVIKQ